MLHLYLHRKPALDMHVTNVPLEPQAGSLFSDGEARRSGRVVDLRVDILRVLPQGNVAFEVPLASPHFVVPPAVGVSDHVCAAVDALADGREDPRLVLSEVQRLLFDATVRHVREAPAGRSLGRSHYLHGVFHTRAHGRGVAGVVGSLVDDDSECARAPRHLIASAVVRWMGVTRHVGIHLLVGMREAERVPQLVDKEGGLVLVAEPIVWAVVDMNEIHACTSVELLVHGRHRYEARAVECHRILVLDHDDARDVLVLALFQVGSRGAARRGSCSDPTHRVVCDSWGRCLHLEHPNTHPGVPYLDGGLDLTLVRRHAAHTDSPLALAGVLLRDGDRVPGDCGDSCLAFPNPASGLELVA